MMMNFYKSANFTMTSVNCNSSLSLQNIHELFPKVVIDFFLNKSIYTVNANKLTYTEPVMGTIHKNKSKKKGTPSLHLYP